MEFKYFKVESNMTVDLLKKQYRKLAFKYHPDMGGTNREMKEVIAEYERALGVIGKAQGKDYKLDQEFVDIIEALIKLRMQGVEIEICGWFLYLHGDTRTYKEKLKELRFRWAPKKRTWYWKPPWYRKRNRRDWTMDQIREKYGSQKVHHSQEREQDYKQESIPLR